MLDRRGTLQFWCHCSGGMVATGGRATAASSRVSLQAERGCSWDNSGRGAVLPRSDTMAAVLGVHGLVARGNWQHMGMLRVLESSIWCNFEGYVFSIVVLDFLAHDRQEEVGLIFRLCDSFEGTACPYPLAGTYLAARP